MNGRMAGSSASGNDARAGEAGPGRAEEERPEPHAFRLALRLDRVEERLERLRAEIEESSAQVGALTQHLTAPPADSTRDRSLAELLARVESAHERIEDLAGAMNRLSRVQFKANALQDGKDEQVAGALATLREIATRRDAARAARDAQDAGRPGELRAEGRAEMAVELLPVLDGIERALDSGAILLRRHEVGRGAATGRPGPLRTFLRALAGGQEPRGPSGDPGRELARSLAAWLEGLTLGHERFLSLLATEGIRPIPALERPFDPHVHHAVASEERDDVPPDTVVRVLRTGYRHGERPLRFAEVVVSRAPTADGTRGTSRQDGPHGTDGTAGTDRAG